VVADEFGSAPAIEVNNLWKTYGPVEALRGVDLTVAGGSFLTIFGPNGAGKTTLMKVLATLVRPTDGSALVGGHDVKRDAGQVRRQVGVISHNTYLYPQLTALENLAFYGRMYGLKRAQDRSVELLEQMGLSGRRHDRVGTFSRGMQQRLSVARALLHDPALLLLDEPYTGLDQHASRILSRVLEAVPDGRRTVVMTTHNLQEGLERCDRVAILVDGRLVLDQAAQDVDKSGFQATYFSCVEKARRR
jgi:heme exporter protein A